MSRKKQETKVLCPGCGTEFAIADKEFAATGTVIGKNSDLGTVYPVVAGHNSPAGLPKGARERIEALRGAGVDVSCLFAMQEPRAASISPPTKTGNLPSWMTTTRYSAASWHRVPFPTTDSSAGGSWHKCSI